MFICSYEQFVFLGPEPSVEFCQLGEEAWPGWEHSLDIWGWCVTDVTAVPWGDVRSWAGRSCLPRSIPMADLLPEGVILPVGWLGADKQKTPVCLHQSFGCAPQLNPGTRIWSLHFPVFWKNISGVSVKLHSGVLGQN